MRECHPTFGSSFLLLILICAWLAHPPVIRGETISEESGASPDAPELTLAFSDDFSTDPNTNGQWTIRRNMGDPMTEAAWAPVARTWRLTRAALYRGVAVFANYELTATTWKAEFRYRASKLGGLQGGGDGFVFMFYKNKAAYGSPASGFQKGFHLANGSEVAGYGLQFDNYIEGCDPRSTDYIALIQNNVCNFLGVEEFDWIGATDWHRVRVAFKEGTVRIFIDGMITLETRLPAPDYSFSGIGFGAGTGGAVGDYEIDNFQLWVSD